MASFPGCESTWQLVYYNFIVFSLLGLICARPVCLSLLPYPGGGPQTCAPLDFNGDRVAVLPRPSARNHVDKESDAAGVSCRVRASLLPELRHHSRITTTIIIVVVDIVTRLYCYCATQFRYRETKRDTIMTAKRKTRRDVINTVAIRHNQSRTKAEIEN